MADFEPIIISDFDLGLYSAKQPWISPAKAWTILENGYVRKGRVVKRSGYGLLGTMYPIETETPTPATNQVGTLTHGGTYGIRAAEVSPSNYKVTFTDQSGTPQVVTDDGAGNMIGDIGAGTNTINYSTGAYDFHWASAPVGTVTVTYEYDRVSSVMGLYEFRPRNDVSFLVAADQYQLYVWNSSEGRFNHLSTTDQFTGGDDDFFVFAEFDEELFITNNTDPIQKYSPFGGTILQEAATDWDPGSGGNDIDRAAITIQHRRRLLHFNLTENGTQRANRVRFTEINTPEVYDEFDFKDAPISRAIQTVTVVNDIIQVHFDGNITKELEYTGDPLDPYDWADIRGKRGAASRMGHANPGPFSVLVDLEEMVVADGREIREYERDNPDLVLSWDVGKKSYYYGHVAKQLDQMWFNYVKIGDSVPNNQLVLDYKTQAAAIFNLPMHCYTQWQTAELDLWDDHTEDFDDWTAPFDEGFREMGSPVTLAGDRSGRVFKMFTQDSDNGSDIAFKARTQRLNPWRDQNQRAHLGYIQIICTKDPDVEIQVCLYVDFKDVPYHAGTYTLAGPTDAAKTVITIDVNQVGVAHMVEIIETGNRKFSVDGLILHMKPQGPWRNPV